MAFAKYANAKITKASIATDDWNKVRTASKVKVSSDSQIKDYSPDKYLLTHCTIIASVDVDENGPKNDKGWYFYITPETEQYVNSNQDSWERSLLLLTYKTFIGGFNFVEHIQVPELSKGTIVDAVARDVGDSIYIDILVATDLKHEELIKDIEEERISTLSMGCSVEFTICTQCGNVAIDDTQLCTHIKYQKGNHFLDKRGRKRKIAELCGHFTDPKSVKFIEASWVANPAFKGAVLRNIIQPEEVKEAAIKAAFEAMRSDIDPLAMQKAASVTNALRTANFFLKKGEGFDFGDAGGDEGADPAAEPAPAPAGAKDPIKDLTEELKVFIRNKVRDELHTEIKGPTPSDTGSENGNENLVRSTFAFADFKKRYAHMGTDLHLYRVYEGLVSIKTGGWKSLKTKGFTGRDILALSVFIDRNTEVKDVLTHTAYQAIAKVGGTSKFASSLDYLNACAKVMGTKKITLSVAKALIYKGHLYSYGS